MATAKLKDREAKLNLLFFGDSEFLEDLENLFVLKLKYIKDRERLVSMMPEKILTLYNAGFSEELPELYRKKISALEKKKEILNNLLRELENQVPNFKERCPYAYEF